MRVLIACEVSGIVRDAFTREGHMAVSCDLKPTEAPGEHFQGDVRKILDLGWDLMIAHPPCTHLAVSGARWFEAKTTEQIEALEFVKLLMAAPIEKIAIENPVSIISTHIRKPKQIIQPYEYGHDASKRTCLWLKNLPYLYATKYIRPRIVRGQERWANQTDSGQNKLGPSEERAALRAETYPGIAEAMARQWGGEDNGYAV